MVLHEGVTLVRDKVVDLVTDGNKIRSVETECGARFTSPWFIDASGMGTPLIARTFNLPSVQYGPTKVAMWTYFKVPQQVEGTTLYMDASPTEYLEWIWEIPVTRTPSAWDTYLRAQRLKTSVRKAYPSKIYSAGNL